MIRDGVLKTKRNELQNSSSTHTRVLRELYHATVGLRGPGLSCRDHNSANHNTPTNYDEVQFLNANDLSKGHFFDCSTLLHIIPKVPDTLQSAQQEVTLPYSGVRPSQQSTTGELHTPATSKESPGSAHINTTSADGVFQGTERVKQGERVIGAETGSEVGPVGKDRVLAGSGTSRVRNEAELVDETALQNTPKPEDVRTATTAESHSLVDDSDWPDSGKSQNLRSGDDGRSTPRGREASAKLQTPSVSTPDAQLRSEAAQFLDPKGHLGAHRESQDAPKAKPADSVFSSPKTQKSPAKGTGRLLEAVESSKLAARRRGLSPDPSVTGLVRDFPKDLTLSQRPPMRIDTVVERQQASKESQVASPSTTPLRSAASMQSSPPERMTTRVSSGVLRHKSVSEILGETPRSANLPGDRTPTDKPGSDKVDHGDLQTPRYGSMVASPDSMNFRSRFSELKEREKDRSKLSTVVFAPRQQQLDGYRSFESGSGELHHKGRPSNEIKDYLLQLFTAQASAQSQGLNHLIRHAHKTLTTKDHFTDYQEGSNCRVLKRIYQLQNANRWTLRQTERAIEPARPTAHWDMLLSEVKWMRTDFREERKWKIAAAKNLADWCAEWVVSPVERRTMLQIKLHKSASRSAAVENHVTPVSLNDHSNNTESIDSEATPELDPSNGDDISDIGDEDVVHVDVSRPDAPAAMFSLAPEDIVFNLDQTPVSDRLLAELPLYQPFHDPRGAKRPLSETLDDAWKTPVALVSKHAMTKFYIREEGPVKKRSRYDYEEEDVNNQDEVGRTTHPVDHATQTLPPEQSDVALFNPENKHIIARLHAAHAFRPPSEFSMPTQAFFEARHSSQWTVAEDDELRRLVREYEYNWSLISASLSSPSLFSSTAERRTPWECFERWVSFEGLPGDMARHQYFRAWNSRRDSARHNLEQLYLTQQQAPNANQGHIRRRSAEPMGVERRRNSKHLALIQGMCKVAKKKEAALHKQAHVASLAALRKHSEPVQPRQRMQTPREFSAHKYKQECEFKEKQLLYRQQLAANQRAVLAQRAAQQADQQQAVPGLPQPARNGLPSNANATNSHLASALPNNAMQPGSRPPQPGQATMGGLLPNGVQAPNGQLNLRGAGAIPSAQMQAYLQGHQRLPSQAGQDNARIIMEASRLSEQQRLMQQRQYQTLPNGANGLNPGHHSGSMNMQHQPNAAMLANLAASSGKLSPSANGNPGLPRASNSPATGNAAQAQQLSGGMVPVLNQITSQLKTMHPGATNEQIKQMATANLNQHLRSQNQQVGSSMAVNGNLPLSLQQQQALAYNAQMMNPQLYAQFMRSQQASQQSRNINGDSSGSRPDSRGTQSQQKGGPTTNGSSQSPRPPQAQMAGSS